MSSFSIAKRPDGVAVLAFDLPGQKVNKLTTAVLNELDALLDRLAADREILAMVVASGKDGSFIAGADIAEIGDITEAARGEELSRRGQAVMDKIEALPFPTVAAIHGACLGGGLELALACSSRVVSDDPKTCLGLPEVTLGILPCFGGTLRLPRLIGLAKGLDLIVSGRPVPPAEAVRIGLADAVVPRDGLLTTAEQMARSATDRPGRVTGRPRRSLLMRLIEDNPLARVILLQRARRRVLTATRGNYPAPLAALDAVRAGLRVTVHASHAREAALMGQLSVSIAAKNLIHIFHLKEMLKRARSSDRPAAGSGISAGEIAEFIARREDARSAGGAKSGPGCLLSRLLMPYLAEAVRLLEEGATVEKVDDALLQFGMTTGAFMQLDEMGIDTAHQAAMNLYSGSEDQVRLPPLVAHLIASGQRGRKSGRGFYDYSGNRRKGVNPLVRRHRKSGNAAGKHAPEEIVDRTVLLMLKEAVLCLEEGIVSRPELIDALSVFAIGFPSFRGGMFRYADAFGAKQVVERLEALAAKHGDRFTPPQSLREMSRDDLIGQIVR